MVRPDEQKWRSGKARFQIPNWPPVAYRHRISSAAVAAAVFFLLVLDCCNEAVTSVRNQFELKRRPRGCNGHRTILPRDAVATANTQRLAEKVGCSISAFHAYNRCRSVFFFFHLHISLTCDCSMRMDEKFERNKWQREMPVSGGQRERERDSEIRCAWSNDTSSSDNGALSSGRRPVMAVEASFNIIHRLLLGPSIHTHTIEPECLTAAWTVGVFSVSLSIYCMPLLGWKCDELESDFYVERNIQHISMNSNRTEFIDTAAQGDALARAILNATTRPIRKKPIWPAVIVRRRIDARVIAPYR